MHTKIAYQKRGGQRKERPAPVRDGLMEPEIPNSTRLAMLSGGGQPGGMPVDELGQRVMSRLPSVQARPQAQIPQAESEADRLSAAVNTGTPESVKAVMGQRMGADFSGVRFHTGAADAARADAMGARAYTSGADVYFGTGGFDPSVAAHELVHTAQQGMVDSGAPTMSTPVGGVQMLKLFGRHGKKKGAGAEQIPEKITMGQRAGDAVYNTLAKPARKIVGWAHQRTGRTAAPQDEPYGLEPLFDEEAAAKQAEKEANTGRLGRGLKAVKGVASAGKRKLGSAVNRGKDALAGKITAANRQVTAEADAFNINRKEYEQMRRRDRAAYAIQHPVARMIASHQVAQTIERQTHKDELRDLADQYTEKYQGKDAAPMPANSLTYEQMLAQGEDPDLVDRMKRFEEGDESALDGPLLPQDLTADEQKELDALGDTENVDVTDQDIADLEAEMEKNGEFDGIDLLDEEEDYDLGDDLIDSLLKMQQYSEDNPAPTKEDFAGARAEREKAMAAKRYHDKYAATALKTDEPEDEEDVQTLGMKDLVLSKLPGAEQLKAMMESLDKGDTKGALASGMRAVGGIVGGSSSAVSGAEKAGTDMGESKNLVSGAGSFLEGAADTLDAVRAGSHRSRLGRLEKSMAAHGGAGGRLSHQDEQMRRIVQQAKGTASAGAVKKGTSAFGQFAKTAGTFASMLGGPVGALLSPVVNAVGTGVSAVGDFFAGDKQKEVNTQVANEEYHVDKRAQRVLRDNPELSENDAKHVASMALGSKYGTRKELTAMAIEERVAMLVNLGNAGHPEAVQILDAMGVKPQDGQYNAALIADQLGAAGTKHKARRGTGMNIKSR